MDLDRPSRLGSSPVPRLPLPNLGVSNLSTYTVPPRERSESAQDASNLDESREKGGFVTLAASPADASAAKVADPIGKDRPSTPSPLLRMPQVPVKIWIEAGKPPA